MNILFRVDAGGKTGLGHFFRSVTLAKALHKKRVGITITHRPSDFWAQVELPFPMIAVDEGKEEEHTFQLIEEGDFSVYYVDGIINFSEDFIDSLRQLGVKVVFYQNISEARHLCDVFILPSLRHEDDFFKDFGKSTKVFKGLDYVFFNEKVYQLQPKKESKEMAENIGIVTGGSDPRGVLLTIHSLIGHKAFEQISFTYFYGKDFLHKENIPAHTQDNVQFLPFDQQHISNMDLVICTFGVSTYELMFLGIPILSVGHQASNAEASKIVAEQTEGIIDLGQIDHLDGVRLNDILKRVIASPQQRKTLSENAKKAVDAFGAERVVGILKS